MPKEGLLTRDPEKGYVLNESAWITTELDLLSTSLDTFVALAHNSIKARATALFPPDKYPLTGDDYEGMHTELWTKSDGTGCYVTAWQNENIRVDLGYGPHPEQSMTYCWQAYMAMTESIDESDSIVEIIFGDEEIDPRRKRLQSQVAFWIFAVQIRTDRLHVSIMEAANLYRDEPDTLLPFIKRTWGDGMQVLRPEILVTSGNEFTQKLEPLTRAQLEVANLTADGLSQGEIATQLVKAIPTVKSFKKQIRERLGIEGGDLAIALRQRGYGTRVR